MLSEAWCREIGERTGIVDYEQLTSPHDRDGSYNFKGLYCSLVRAWQDIP